MRHAFIRVGTGSHDRPKRTVVTPVWPVCDPS